MVKDFQIVFPSRCMVLGKLLNLSVPPSTFRQAHVQFTDHHVSQPPCSKIQIRYQCSMATITNHHKIDSSTKQKFILPQSWRPEIQSQRCSPACSSYGGSKFSLAYTRAKLPNPVSIFTRLSLLCLYPPFLSLIITCDTGFMVTWVIQGDLITRYLITLAKTLFPNKCSVTGSGY